LKERRKIPRWLETQRLCDWPEQQKEPFQKKGQLLKVLRIIVRLLFLPLPSLPFLSTHARKNLEIFVEKTLKTISLKACLAFLRQRGVLCTLQQTARNHKNIGLNHRHINFSGYHLSR
jgi:hypothetical protein